MTEKSRASIGLFIRLTILSVSIIFISLFSGIIYKTFFIETNEQSNQIDYTDTSINNISEMLAEINTRMINLEKSYNTVQKENDNLDEDMIKIKNLLNTINESIEYNTNTISKLVGNVGENKSSNTDNNLTQKTLQQTKQQCKAIYQQNNEMLIMIKRMKDKVEKCEVEKNVKLKQNIEYKDDIE